MPLPNWLRYVNKCLTNRFTLKIAGLSFSPISIVYHTGRKSGKPYLTPVIAEPIQSGFMFALTYGPDVDWYRNVQAARGCELLWHGKKYSLENPETMAVRDALAAFPFPFKYILRLTHMQHFFKMRVQR